MNAFNFLIIGLAMLFVVAFMVCLVLAIIVKNNRNTWCKRGTVSFACAFFLCFIFVMGTQDELDEGIRAESTDPNIVYPQEGVVEPTLTDTSREIAWKDLLSESLGNEIYQAFCEIGEDPQNIVSVEYRDERITDLFVRRNYIVTFFDHREKIGEIFDEDKMGWVHHPTYLITTQEWYEGEPEKEQYPEEYLVIIKFYDGEDITTNINQWMHTGGGKLQGN